MSRLLQGSSRLLQVDTSSSLLGASGIFFRDSSKVDINDNQFSKKKESENIDQVARDFITVNVASHNWVEPRN
jgi:hypothetical protein